MKKDIQKNILFHIYCIHMHTHTPYIKQEFKVPKHTQKLGLTYPQMDISATILCMVKLSSSTHTDKQINPTLNF